MNAILIMGKLNSLIICLLGFTLKHISRGL